MRLVTPIVVLAIAAAAIWPSPAAAALWVRIEVGRDPAYAGIPVWVTVQTLTVAGADCLDDPDGVATPVDATASTGPGIRSMTLHASAMKQPEGFDIRLVQDPEDGTRWRALVVFPAPGRWRLEMRSPSWPGATDACSGAGRFLTVRARTWP